MRYNSNFCMGIAFTIATLVPIILSILFTGWIVLSYFVGLTFGIYFVILIISGIPDVGYKEFIAKIDKFRDDIKHI